MKIVELRIDSFKRIRAVQIQPDGTLCQITGRNAQGKSSVLDAIAAALAGKDAAPDRPIHTGAASAEVVVNLGDLVVTRRWTADDKSTLVVASKDGARYPSPQAMLDKLLGALTFDPLAFVRSTDREQATTLRRLAGIDTATIDHKRKGAYDERTEVNRALKLEQARLEAMGMPTGPDEPISVTELLTALANAEKQKKDNDNVRKVAEASEIGRRRIDEQIKEALAHVERLGREREELDARHRHDVAVADALQDPDMETIHAQIAAAESTNSQVRLRQERRAQLERTKEWSDRAAALTGKIEQLDQEKGALLAAATFPVPGLSVDGDTPTYNSIPLAQASGAEQLRVGLAVAAALNPQLRVCLVRDGSLLDADGLKLVGAWAEEQGMQVIMERVAGESPIGVVIEDGMVAGADASP